MEVLDLKKHDFLIFYEFKSLDLKVQWFYQVLKLKNGKEWI